MISLLPTRTLLLLVSFTLITLPVAAYAQTPAEPNACVESESQFELRTELAKVYGLKRHIEPVSPAIWALETMDSAHHCEVSCRNNLPYNNLYLSYKGFEANGKPCEGQTSVVMAWQGLIKLLAPCMAGCGVVPVTTTSTAQ